nr:immunoglobulin light chain junction region [Macaca mulatta]MOW08672.1 immunoglobulin light chain junction region [Macaca mulatta]MOW08717.1 immunoglobulin light chain junction region [Macaca mulatta]MOW08733.1 immunoglobulin light chain junction region [Macaca mulatta]MOW09171.1 immunoglobulin light chain junction region [Macaca mulatta]
CQKYTTSPFTF